MKTSFSLLVVLLLFMACKESPTALSADGIWLQLGYGKIFEIKGDSVKIYDHCKPDCHLYKHTLLADKGKVHELSTKKLVLKKNIKTYQFERLDQLPNLCASPLQNLNSPIHNFEVLWHTFNENYCYFEDHKIDWKKTYDEYHSQISEHTTKAELFVLLDEMLSLLNDGHVDIEMPESLEAAVSTLTKEKNESKKEKPIVNRFALAEMIADKHCKNCKTYNAGLARWGYINSDIAYLQMNGMIYMADYDISKNLSLNEFGAAYHKIASHRVFQRQDEIDGARHLMNKVFVEFENAKALIIDLRINTGGKDEVGLEIIGHLVKEKTQVASKKAKLGYGFTNQQNIYIDPRLPYFSKPIYILTSNYTASAAELAVLSTLSLDHITRIGGNTEGSFSDGLDKTLPNGWEYVMSNEIYEDLSGNHYEGVGIAPIIDLNYPSDKAGVINLIHDQLKGAGDAAINKVIELEAL